MGGRAAANRRMRMTQGQRLRERWRKFEVLTGDASCFPPCAGGRAEGKGVNGTLLFEVFRALALQKRNRAGNLVEPLHASFDRNPAIETNVGQQPENRVVVVEALARFAMLQRRRVPKRAVTSRK